MGSSPHTRGARHLPRRPGVVERIIPAYAGSTEKPRHEKELIPRIIPAYAGSTPPIWLAIRRARDHPRIRGEHTPQPKRPSQTTGSSPHTRGAPPRGVVRKPGRRIIPAYAGSTSTASKTRCRPRDHPRIRGEHLNRIKNEMPSEGSSPHTRGAPCFGAVVDPEGGIIPAYAGSTVVVGVCDVYEPDHPRIRGEHDIRFATLAGNYGSSPHTRGARADEPRHRRRVGIIPAYAGSTAFERLREAVAEDHPRIRGEHRGTLGLGRAVLGSSPHTRGAPDNG